ncbi:hypothetical protein ACLK2I_00860 [Escherichia coli]
MRFFPVLLLALLVVAAAALTWMNFSQALPRSQSAHQRLVAGY